jgi:hypothetical protein
MGNTESANSCGLRMQKDLPWGNQRMTPPTAGLDKMRINFCGKVSLDDLLLPDGEEDDEELRDEWTISSGGEEEGGTGVALKSAALEWFVEKDGATMPCLGLFW